MDKPDFRLFDHVELLAKYQDDQKRIAEGMRPLFSFGFYQVVKKPYPVEVEVAKEWHGFLGLQRRAITKTAWKMEVCGDDSTVDRPFEVDCADWIARARPVSKELV
jgi:hypothetical protein